MRIEWDEDLTTSIPLVDTQHQNILIKTNEFLEAMNEGRGELEAANAIKLLKDWADSHFSIQEKYMLENGYPKYELHKADHEKYVKVVGLLENEFKAQASSSYLVKKIETALLHYWTEHVPKFDKPLAEFLRDNIEKLIL